MCCLDWRKYILKIEIHCMCLLFYFETLDIQSFFFFVSRCVHWSAGYFLEQSCWLLYNQLSNLAPFDLETKVAQYEFQVKVFHLLGYYQYPLDLVARIEPNLILTAFIWNNELSQPYRIQHFAFLVTNFYSDIESTLSCSTAHDFAI